jgi:hypothetical protein
MAANQLITTSFDYIFISANPTAQVNIATLNGSEPGHGYLHGIFCSNETQSTNCNIYDVPDSGTINKIVDTFVLTGGQFYLIPAKFQSGCNIVISGSGTANITVFYNRP